MNSKFRFLILIGTLLLLITILTGCSNTSNDGDKFVMGGTFRLNEGETIEGNLAVFGGAVNLEKDSTIKGDVILIGGTVNAAGTIDGDVQGMGGSISLADTAIVGGDVSTFGASVSRSDKAVIKGKVISQSEDGVNLPDVPRILAPSIFKPIGDFLGGILRALVLGILAVVLTLFIPRQTATVGEAIVDSPFTAGAIGLLTLLLFPFVIVLLFITLCLIPISLAGMVVMILGVLLGWIAIGLETGNRIAALFKSSWAPAVNAGLGTLVITLLTSLFSAIPCVGWVVPTIVVLLATGGVVITVFGTRKGNNPKPRTNIPHPIPPNPPPTTANPTAMNRERTLLVEQSIIDTSPEPDTQEDSEEVDKFGDPKGEVKKNKQSKPRTRKPKIVESPSEIFPSPEQTDSNKNEKTAKSKPASRKTKTELKPSEDIPEENS